MVAQKKSYIADHSDGSHLQDGLIDFAFSSKLTIETETETEKVCSDGFSFTLTI